MSINQFKVRYKVTVSHEEESKSVTISGERTYEAESAEQAEERANKEWENGLESNFIDGKHLLDDDIFDVSLDILEVTGAVVKKEIDSKSLTPKISKMNEKKKELVDYLKKFKEKPGLYFIYKKEKIIYIGIAKNLYVRAKQEMGWSNIEGATFVKKMAREKGYKTNDKYNKKIQAEVHEYIIANFRIECKPYKGRKTDYQKEIKPVLLKEETRQIEMFSPKYNTKKNS